MMLPTLEHLLGVAAAIGVRGLLDTSGNAHTVGVASRVGNASRSPDAPGTVNAVRAGNQIVSSELKVAILLGPALALGVLGSGLGTRGVSNLALACIIKISYVPAWWYYECDNIPMPERST